MRGAFQRQSEEVIIAADHDIDRSGRRGVKDRLIIGVSDAKPGAPTGATWVYPDEELLPRRLQIGTLATHDLVQFGDDPVPENETVIWLSRDTLRT